MQKRILLTLSIAFLVIGFYPMLLRHFYPEYGKAETPSAVSSMTLPFSSSGKNAPMPVMGEVYAEQQNVLFKNEKIQLVFSSMGGGVRDISFLDYQDSETREALKFVSLKDSMGAPLGLKIMGDEAYDKASHQLSLRENSAQMQSSALAGTVNITKSLVFNADGYSADLSVVFTNVSDNLKDIQYELFAGGRIAPRHSIDSQYIESNFFSTVENPIGKIRHINDTKKDRLTTSVSTVDWIAAKDRHFSIIIKPENKNQFTAVSRGLGDHQWIVSLVSPKATLPAGGVLTQKFKVYFGPNDLKYLEPVGLEKIVNFGKLDLIGKLLVGSLDMLNSVFKNYGLAIIVLTILLNVLLFPLTRLSYMSMKRMQLVQPQMTKLREQYGKNQEKLNKEMMELYKKNKVNPFGGCIPMLMQMPIFMALYVALSKTVALIDARFLWARDLSSPDRVNLMGHDIHVLPLIMVAAMAIQQKFTQIKIEGQDPSMEQQQKIMAVMMPILFGFIFYSMPSGLVLYWLTNTLLMSAYQLHLKKMTLT